MIDQKSLLPVNFPRLIRFSSHRSSSSKRLAQRSQDNAKPDPQPTLGDSSFRITDLKKYERQQREPVFEQFHSSPPRENNQTITQTKLVGRKLNQFSMFDLMPISVKQEFFQGKVEVLKILEDYGIINEQLTHLVETLKCYRYELGSSVERIGSMFFKLLERLLETNIKLFNEGKMSWQQEIVGGNEKIEKLEGQIKQMEERQRNYKNLLTYHESEYKICRLNSDAQANEIIMLHDLIKKDLFQMMSRIGQLEQSRTQNPDTLALSDEPSDKLVYNLKTLQRTINNIEQEHEGNDLVINSMNGLLKAMIKGSKQDHFTQVDEGELLMNAQLVVATKNPTHEPPRAVIDFMQATGSSWNLTPTLLQFMNNVVKDNESGRVVPWNAFKQLLYSIYQARASARPAIQQILGGNTVPLDEFVCIHMLNLYKLRRTAEIKLLEFLVSLKYYLKSYPRALMFAKLLGIVQITGSASEGSSLESQLSVKLDEHLLGFFLFSYQTISDLPPIGTIFETEEENTFICLPKSLELVPTFLPFAPEGQRQKFRKKLEKGSTRMKGEETVMIDLDLYFNWLVQEYLESKRNSVRTLIKNFTRRIEGDRNGICDMKEFQRVLDYERGHGVPRISEFVGARTFFQALTSGQNTFQLNSTQFLQACSLYGVDTPFNIIVDQASPQMRSMIQDSMMQSEPAPQDMLKNMPSIMTQPSRMTLKNQGTLKDFKLPTGQDTPKDQGASLVKIDPPQKRLDFSQQIHKLNTAQVSMLAQHLNIIKELTVKVGQFRTAVEREEDPERLWEEFRQLAQILDASVTFLNFPQSK